MTSAPNRLILFVCGIYLHMRGCLQLEEAAHLKIRSMTSWIEAHNNPPNMSYELISPFRALEIISDIRNLTDGPIYVNGFTYGAMDHQGGAVIQLSNRTRKFSICCKNNTDYENPYGKFTYKDGVSHCKDKRLYYPIDFAFLDVVGISFFETVFWINRKSIPAMFTQNETINCMVLELSGEGRLMLENCSRTHEAVYIQDQYEQTVKKYTNSSRYPFYDPDRYSSATTSTGTESTSASTFSTARKSSKGSTQQHGESSTGTPEPVKPGTTNKIQGIVGMNPDIFFALVGVGSVVIIVVVVICIICCLSRRKTVRVRRTALSDDYSNPIDSIGAKDVEMNVNSNNGLYASPQDSITPVKAKKRDSISEGMYDVTFTSGQRKPNAKPSQAPVNAYSHVTIQAQGGALVDGEESHYDSTSYVKPQHKVFVSPTHSEGTYGDVQIKTQT